MTILPGAGTISNPARTEGEGKQYWEDTRSVIAELLGGSAEEALTIASGLITPTVASVLVDTEGAAATDTLTHAGIANHPAGRILTLRSADAARVVTVQHGGAGDGGFVFADGADKVLAPNEWLLFQRIGQTWHHRLNPGAGGGSNTWTDDDLRRMAVAIAELQGTPLGFVNGVADSYGDTSGIDAAASTNATHDASGGYYHNPVSGFGPNLFTSGPAMSADSVRADQPSWTPDRLVDGNVTTEWHNNDIAGGGWCQYDLGAGNEMAIGKLRMYSNGLANRISGFDFQGSNNAVDWTTLLSAGLSTDSAWHEWIFGNSTNYRYYRMLRTAGDGYAGFMEWEAFAPIGAALDMTLTSVGFTATVAPTLGRIYHHVNADATGALNTDLIAQVSRDDGTTWSAATLIDRGIIQGGSVRIISDDAVDLSSQPTGTAPRYQVLTKNGHYCRIYDSMLQWG